MLHTAVVPPPGVGRPSCLRTRAHTHSAKIELRAKGTGYQRQPPPEAGIGATFQSHTRFLVAEPPQSCLGAATAAGYSSVAMEARGGPHGQNSTGCHAKHCPCIRCCSKKRGRPAAGCTAALHCFQAVPQRPLRGAFPIVPAPRAAAKGKTSAGPRHNDAMTAHGTAALCKQEQGGEGTGAATHTFTARFHRAARKVVGD